MNSRGKKWDLTDRHGSKKKVEPDETVKNVLKKYVNEINIVFMNELEWRETRKSKTIRAWSSKSENGESEELDQRAVSNNRHWLEV